jgi:hypothetical protein
MGRSGACVCLGLLSWTPPALGQSADVDLSIDCPLLDDPGLEEFEARARAELASSPSRVHSVAVECAGSSAAVALLTRGGEPTARDIEVGEDRTTLVEHLLDALHSLLREQASASQTTVTPEASPLPETETPPAPPRETPADDQVQDAATANKPLGLKIGIVAGVDSELWQGALGAALGAHAGGRFSAGDRWALSLVGGFAWGLGSDKEVGAMAFHGVLQVDYLLLSHAAIGLGITARDVHADATGAGAQDGASAGVVVSGRYVARLGKTFAVYAGPRLEALAQPLIVQVNGAESFRIPRFVAGFSFDGSVDFGP